MNRILQEDLDAFGRAAKRAPGQPHVATLHRWRTRGVRGVRLEAVRVGGRWHTSQAAIERFIIATTNAVSSNRSESEMPRNDEQQRVEQQLDQRGL